MTSLLANRTARRRGDRLHGAARGHAPDDGLLVQPGRPRAPERHRLRVPAHPGGARHGRRRDRLDRRGDHRDRPPPGRQRAPCATRTNGWRNENARLQETRRENDQLTALLQLQSGFDFQTTAASVIGREPSEFRRRITLDKGTDDGLAVGDVVMAAGGALAGRITEIGPDSATVMLLTDAESTVIGQLTSNAATGEVVGQLGGVLVMNQIDSSQQVGLERRGRDGRHRRSRAGSGRRIPRAC